MERLKHWLLSNKQAFVPQVWSGKASLGEVNGGESPYQWSCSGPLNRKEMLHSAPEGGDSMVICSDHAITLLGGQGVHTTSILFTRKNEL